MKTMNYSLIRILFALVIGLVLVLWPNTAASYIVITVGVAFLIPGVISLFGYFGRKKSEDGVSPRFPIEGVGSLLFGLWLIVMPEFFADVLMFLLGFILSMGGVQQIASLSMARRWTPAPGASYLVPALILIAGIVALFNPTGARNTAFIIIGISSPLLFLILFNNLRILNILIVRRNRSLRTTARKLKPVDQFGQRINQATDTDNNESSITYSRRIEQRNNTCDKNQ